jgi:hypothetical protein
MSPTRIGCFSSFITLEIKACVAEEVAKPAVVS